ncbi:MAG: hypothetical protein KC609_06535 [Myxococcales bacterium]|nr:hypothetical protein [Myxococcales bacterium]
MTRTQPLSGSPSGTWVRIDRLVEGKLRSFGIYRCREDQGSVRCVRAQLVDHNGKVIDLSD